MSRPQIVIDVVSDIICPWCWVGKRRLESAIRMDGGRHDFTVKWHPFMLRPNTPVEGVPKPPQTPGNPRVGERLKQAGREVGIDFTGRCDRAPNTTLGHVLLDHALAVAGPAKQNEVQERIFQAYFTDGAFPDAHILTSIASASGLDAATAAQTLADPAAISRVQEMCARNTRAAPSGVPSFYINGRFAFSGAQPEAAFLQLFQ
eukprot:TRINITY_DN6366_c0_g1_i1.p2 TRINITY_DN6366_c0_g1~~TRINITY_DN6366_c0_g1_i1.p2  ORF type:complete len:204 (+),score=10.31 TRINITY_DN6366_c0_g1_i1:167-778(+)